jgi:hypothetical protein
MASLNSTNHMIGAAPKKPGRAGKAPHDTAAGCRVRARADLLNSSSADTEHGRQRLAHSAATWAKRGDLLERIEASFRARLTAKPILSP